MPPAIPSDSESDFDANGVTAIPKKSPAKRAKKQSYSPEPSDEELGYDEDAISDAPQTAGAVDALGDDEDEEDGEDEYTVEKICGHFVEAGTIKYEVKWKGYSMADNTGEPEENLEGAKDILELYWKKIGGRPVDGSNPIDKLKKRGRKSQYATETPDPPSKKMKTQLSVRKGRPPRGGVKDEEEEEEQKLAWPVAEDSWKPPKVAKDSWEDLMLSVEAINQDETSSKKDGQLWAYVTWAVLDNNGKNRTSKVLLESVHKAAPQAAINFYKSHLAFVESKK